MALGWALKEMSDSQFLQMCDRMNDRAKQNLPILNTIRRELAGTRTFSHLSRDRKEGAVGTVYSV